MEAASLDQSKAGGSKVETVIAEGAKSVSCTSITHFRVPMRYMNSLI